MRQAIDRGTLIYAYDQAAWHGSDDARGKISDISVVGGWVVDGPAAAPELVMYDKDPGDPHAVYIADFRDGKLVSGRALKPSDDRTLNPARKAMIAAVRIATQKLTAEGARPCAAAPFNIAVLPPSQAGAPTLVYFLTPQTKMDAIPFGGHFLVEVSADGKAGPVRHFTNSCLELSLKPPGKGRPTALFITHLLDPVPTEIHVFSSLAAHVPVAVGTVSNRHLWAVAGAHIELISADLTKH